MQHCAREHQFPMYCAGIKFSRVWPRVRVRSLKWRVVEEMPLRAKFAAGAKIFRILARYCCSAQIRRVFITHVLDKVVFTWRTSNSFFLPELRCRCFCCCDFIEPRDFRMTKHKMISIYSICFQMRICWPRRHCT